MKEEDDFNNPPVSITKTVTGPSRGSRSGGPLSKKKAEPKAVKFNGYDDMDANEDFQPSPEVDVNQEDLDQQQLNDNEDAEDIGMIGGGGSLPTGGDPVAHSIT